MRGRAGEPIFPRRTERPATPTPSEPHRTINGRGTRPVAVCGAARSNVARARKKHVLDATARRSTPTPRSQSNALGSTVSRGSTTTIANRTSFGRACVIDSTCRTERLARMSHNETALRPHRRRPRTSPADLLAALRSLTRPSRVGERRFWSCPDPGVPGPKARENGRNNPTYINTAISSM
jgi:hypothetical protein